MPSGYRLILVVAILAVPFLRVLLQSNGCLGAFRGSGTHEMQTECGDLIGIYSRDFPIKAKESPVNLP
jgi:hypothetical protein